MAKNNRSSSAASGSLQRKGDEVQFNPDYTYIKRDLKRIGILAGSIIAVMVVLSFFI